MCHAQGHDAVPQMGSNPGSLDSESDAPGQCPPSRCYLVYSFEPVCEKTNNLDSDQVGHKPGCTVTEDG